MRSEVFAAAVVWLGCGGAATPAADGADQPKGALVVGETSRAAIEAALPSWQRARERAIVDAEAANALATVPGGAELTIVLGTWCPDSQREVTRFWKALDAVPGEPPFRVRTLGVDRQKHAPDGLHEGLEVRRVPTFIVTRQGREVGRVIETAPRGIEVELLELLR